MAIKTSDIRAAIQDTLETVSSVGVVQAYERFAKDNATLRDYYVVNSQLRGWFITHEKTENTDHGAMDLLCHTWKITGYLALDDSKETELELDKILDSIRSTFQADETMSGAVAGVSVQERGEVGPQVELIDKVVFCGVLCHRAILRLNTYVFEEK
jgi:hypothetical protein